MKKDYNTVAGMGNHPALSGFRVQLLEFLTSLSINQFLTSGSDFLTFGFS